MSDQDNNFSMIKFECSHCLFAEQYLDIMGGNYILITPWS